MTQILAKVISSVTLAKVVEAFTTPLADLLPNLTQQFPG